MTRTTIAVAEVFGPTVQGEGPVIGERTVFVRTGGCPFRCAWCDSLHAVLSEHRREWVQMSAEEVMARVQALSPVPLLVTLSGGDPCMQPLGPLLDLGRAAGYTFCVETEGWLAPSWLAAIDQVVVSPKPPSSAMTNDWKRVDRCVAMAHGAGRLDGHVAIKVPIFDLADLAWFETEVVPRYQHLPLYLSVGNPYPPANGAAAGGPPEWEGRGYELEASALRDFLMQRWAWLAKETIARRLPARILPQLHVLAHGNARGV